MTQDHEYQVVVLHTQIVRAADAKKARKLVLDELARLCESKGKGLTIRIEELT